VCKYGVMALCDDCKMLAIVSRKMGIIKFVRWLFARSVWFYDGSLWINSDSFAIRLRV
jgi:hypothetical protein